jgi:hypothetical protein
VDKGFVFASTNYRLLPDGTIKQMGEDVAKAIHWVHDHAEECGGDSSRMFVMGHSAGAQLAALVCTDDRFIKAEGLSPSIIRGCVPVDGDTDCRFAVVMPVKGQGEDSLTEDPRRVVLAPLKLVPNDRVRPRNSAEP